MPRTIAFIAVVIFFVGTASAEDKAVKIVGTWKLTKSEKLPAGATTTWIFNKEGTASATLVVSGGAEKVYAHKWKIDGNSLSISKAGMPDVYDTATIVKLNDTTLIVKDAAGIEEEFTRLK
jgi:uncharacterized protein (TIGR03066 family)